MTFFSEDRRSSSALRSLRSAWLATALLLIGQVAVAWAQTAPDATVKKIAKGDQTRVQQQKDYAPGLSPTPELISVGGIGGTTLRIFTDPTSKKIDERKQALITAVEAILAAGYILPPVIDVLFTPSSDKGTDIRATTYFSYPNFTLLVPTYCAKWTTQDGVKSTPSTIADEQYKAAFDAAHARRPYLLKRCDMRARAEAKAALCQATLVHELCHVLHYAQNPALAVPGHLQEIAMAPNGSWELEAPMVSRYAAEGRNEFVAEVCTGMIYRPEGYDRGTMTAYRRLGGPRPDVRPNPIPNPDA